MFNSKKTHFSVEDQLIKKLGAYEKMANRKIFLENMTHGIPGKIIGTLGVIFSLYVGEEYMQRNIPGLQKVYNSIHKTIELTPEMISNYLEMRPKESYEPQIPAINDLDSLSAEQRRGLEEYFEKIKPTVE